MSDSRIKAFGASMGSRASVSRLIIFGAAAVTAVAYGFMAHGAEAAGVLVRRFGYPVMLLTVLWWAWSLVRWSPRPGLADLVRGLRQNTTALGLIAGLSISALLVFPYSYKVLYDEAVLQATAWSIHFFREFGTAMRAYEVEGVFRAVGIYVDKRPFFFPFFVSALHDLTGYRPLNAFLLNSALFPICLGLLYTGLRRIASASAALSGLTCFGASVLLAQNANGAGMELLNLVMLLLTVFLAMGYLASPTERSLNALILSGILLAQTRYESALYVFPVAAVVLAGWIRRREVLLPPSALAAPLLLIPSALQNTYLAGTPILWELRADVDSRFSSVHLTSNLKHACDYFFDFTGTILSNPWLYLAGAAALLALAIRAVRLRAEWRKIRPEIWAVCFMAGATFGNLGLLMAYFWGQLDDPIVSRLILPCNGVLAFAIALAVDQVGGPDRVRRVAIILTCGALLVHLGHGSMATAYNRDINELMAEIEWEETWLASLPPAPRLLITNKSAIPWSLKHVAAIATDRAMTAGERIAFHLRQGTFKEVLVSQYYRPVGKDDGFVIDPRDRLPDEFVLEPLIEKRMGARLLRISRLKELRLKSNASVPSTAAPPSAGVAAP